MRVEQHTSYTTATAINKTTPITVTIATARIKRSHSLRPEVVLIATGLPATGDEVYDDGGQLRALVLLEEVAGAGDGGVRLAGGAGYELL
jgi:hypothetical protein